MHRLTTALAVLGAVTILTLAANTVALAATGQSFLLGKSNVSNTITSLTRTTGGTALKVQTASTGYAPFTVNGKAKVTNLNVDKVDGLDGGTRALTWSFTGVVSGSKKFVLTGLAPGNYLLSYEVYEAELSSDAGLPVHCYFHQNVGGTKYGGETSAIETIEYFPSLSGSSVMNQPSGGNLGLQCNVPEAATWNAPHTQPVRISAVPLAGVTPMKPPVLTRAPAR